MKQKNGSGFKAPLGFMLMGISVVLVLTMIISIIINSARMTSIQEDDEELYYDMLYTISTTLINADRDLYQAMLAATQHQAYSPYAPAEVLTVYIDDYNSNAKQALDGVTKAAQIAQNNKELYSEMKDDDGDTFASMASNFASSM